MHRPILLFANLYAYVRYARAVLMFRRRVGYLPNVAAPRRLSDKVLWRKLFDHCPTHVTITDKRAAKEWVHESTCTVSPPSTLWVGTDPHTIPPELLRKPTVLKGTHGCNFNLFLPAGAAPTDIARAQTDRWLATAFGARRLEWAYQQIEPMLLLEPDLACGDRHALTDVSVHTCSARPVIIEVVEGIKSPSAQKAYFRPDGTRWRSLEKQGEEPGGRLLDLDYQPPDCLGEILDVAAVLGDQLDYARIDFLVVDGKAHVGEVTLYPGAGLSPAAPFAAYNEVLEAAWDIRDSWFLTTPHRGLLGLYQWALARHLGNAQ